MRLFLEVESVRRPRASGRDAVDWADAVDGAALARRAGRRQLGVDDNEDDIGPVLAFVIFAGVATIQPQTAALLGGAAPRIYFNLALLPLTSRRGHLSLTTARLGTESDESARA